MLEVSYKDDQGGEVTSPTLGSDFPAGIAEVHISNKNDEQDCSSELERLSTILKQKTGKFQKVYIEGFQQVTPGFLAFLVFMSRKARELSVDANLLNESVCASLAAAIINPVGLTALEIQSPYYDEPSFNDHQIGLLFDAISSSSSLQHFSMVLPYTQNYSMESCDIIARALRQNQSLKSFKLAGTSFANNDSLRSIVSAALIGRRQLETLEIGSMDTRFRIPLSILVEGLCREGCKLKNIELIGIAVDMELTNNAAENSSLVELRLPDAKLTGAQFADFASLFSSLQVLDICRSGISDLTPLGTLLLSEASKLQRIHFQVVSGIGIDDDEWLAFCKMIPRMKSLRSLGIHPQLWESFSEPQTRALLEALWQNTSLECCDVFIKQKDFAADWVRDDPGNLLPKLSVPLSLNRAGRRALRNRPSDQPLKQELLPLVLERATKLNYYSVDDQWKSPSLSSRRPDAVYWLLREIVCPNLDSSGNSQANEAGGAKGRK